MARPKVAVPEDCTKGVAALRAENGDGSMWMTIRISDIRPIKRYNQETGEYEQLHNKDGSKMETRDVAFSFVHEEQWFDIKATLWNKRAYTPGSELTRLYEEYEPRKGQRVKVFFDLGACYGEQGDKGKVWIKYKDLGDFPIYVSRPMKNKCTPEQNALWDALEAKAKEQGWKHTDWLNIHDGEPVNPFQEQEMMEQDAQEQPVSVPAGGYYDDYEL